MKIIYISSTSAGMHNHSIYFDLLQQMKQLGHDITIVYAREARENKETRLYEQEGFTYLGIKTGNMTKNKNLIEKALVTLTIDRVFLKNIKQYLGENIYDLVLYSTPPITFDKTIEHFIQQGSFTYLMLKDIFPQNAVDINLFSKHGLINRYFTRKEKKLYVDAKMIGVMSPANRDFLIERDNKLRNKIEVLPNALKIQNRVTSLKRSDYGLNEDDLILLYGGNLGLPQGIPFVVECMKALETESNVKLVICGTGSEAHLIESAIKDFGLKNTIYLGQLEADKYQQLTSLCDVGLIYLDARFTVPNYPQRILNYMEERKPVICATDLNTDIGSIAVSNNYGFSLESKDAKTWLEYVKILKDDESLRLKMGENAYRYIIENYNVESICDIILAHF